MKLHSNALVAVADGGKLHLYETQDTQGGVTLKALAAPELKAHSAGSGGRHHDSSANPSHGQGAEDDFAAGVAAYLDTAAADGVRQMVLIAAPKTLGELRKHLSKQATATVVAEIAKDLTGHSVKDVEKAIEAASSGG